MTMNDVCWAAITRFDDVMHMGCACTGPPSSTCRISCGSGSRTREGWSAARTSGQWHKVTNKPHVHALYETDGRVIDVWRVCNVICITHDGLCAWVVMLVVYQTDGMRVVGRTARSHSSHVVTDQLLHW